MDNRKDAWAHVKEALYLLGLSVALYMRVRPTARERRMATWSMVVSFNVALPAILFIGRVNFYLT